MCNLQPSSTSTVICNCDLQQQQKNAFVNLPAQIQDKCTCLELINGNLSLDSFSPFCVIFYRLPLFKFHRLVRSVTWISKQANWKSEESKILKPSCYLTCHFLNWPLNFIQQKIIIITIPQVHCPSLQNVSL